MLPAAAQNPLAAWLTAAAVFVGVAGALLAARSIVARRLETISRRTATQLDDLVVDLLRGTRVYLIVALAASAAALVLELPTSLAQGVRVVTIIAITLQAALWGNGIITFWFRSYATRRATADGTSASTIAAFSILARIGLWLLVALLAIDNLGYNVTTLLTGLGITGVAVALAVQNILGDLFAALSIVVDRPFVVGDLIGVDQFTGRVAHIGLKTTRVRSISGEQVIFSNSDLLKSRIRNFEGQTERRIVFVTKLRADTTPDVLARVPSLLREIIEARPQARFERSHFAAFGDTSLDFETVYFVNSGSYQTYMDVQQAINLEILQRFEREGVALAVPAHTTVVVRREPKPAASTR